MIRFHRLEEKCKALFTEEVVFVLLVHEAPSNPCSERQPLIEYFREHGIDLQEFNKESK